MTQIGEPRRMIEVEPIPEPAETPAPRPAPEPEKEPVAP